MTKFRKIFAATLILVSLSALLGYIGLHCLTPDLLWHHKLYQTLRLFALEGPDFQISSQEIPIALNIGRFLAPLSLAIGVVGTILHQSRDLIQSVKLKFLANHNILIGLNTQSIKFAFDTLDQGQKIVVVTDSTHANEVKELQARGAYVVYGSGCEKSSLLAAGISKASKCFILGNKDSVNIDCFLNASNILLENKQTRISPLHYYLGFSDFTLQQSFRSHSLINKDNDKLNISIVNFEEFAAKQNFEDYPLEIDFQGDLRDELQLTFFGFSNTASAYLRQVCLLGHYRSCKPLNVLLITNNQKALNQRLESEFRQLDKVIAYQVVESQSTSPPDLLNCFNEHRRASAWHTLICASHAASQNFALAEYLKTQAAEIEGQILCSFKSSASVSTLLTDDLGERKVGALQSANNFYRWDIIVNDRREEVARLIHTRYFLKEQEKLKTKGENSSVIPWTKLSETKREQNRIQSDHSPVKLRSLGVCPSSPDMAFLENRLLESLEPLSEMEHLRWNALQYMAGWKYEGGKKNPLKLTHPCLVPWDELSEEVKQYDRDAVLNSLKLRF